MTAKIKVALITGAARRIGAEIARILHESGWNIVLHCRDNHVSASKLCAIFNKARSDSAIVVTEDLKKIAKLKRLIDHAGEIWGRLDLLVNNASCFFKTKIGEVTPEIWQEMMLTNLQAPFFLAQYAAPWLVSKQGSIINITDTHVYHPLRDYGVYCIAKAGLTTMTRVLAKELGPQQVRVNAIAPGLINWPEGENALNVATQEQLVAATSLKRAGKPIDVAKAVLFLAQHDYISGQILAIDGGRML